MILTSVSWSHQWCGSSARSVPPQTSSSEIWIWIKQRAHVSARRSDDESFIEVFWLTSLLSGSGTDPTEHPEPECKSWTSTEAHPRRWRGQEVNSRWCWSCRCSWSCCLAGADWRRVWRLPRTPDSESSWLTPSSYPHPEHPAKGCAAPSDKNHKWIKQNELQLLCVAAFTLGAVWTQNYWRSLEIWCQLHISYELFKVWAGQSEASTKTKKSILKKSYIVISRFLLVSHIEHAAKKKMFMISKRENLNHRLFKYLFASLYFILLPYNYNDDISTSLQFGVF